MSDGFGKETNLQHETESLAKGIEAASHESQCGAKQTGEWRPLEADAPFYVEPVLDEWI